MHFEWDPDKSRSNKTKHGIDFEAAQNIWLNNDRIEIKAPHPVEDRWIVIGTTEGKVWAAVYTFRGNIIRIISARRVREKEVKLYEEETIRKDSL